MSKIGLVSAGRLENMKEYSCIVCGQQYKFDGNWPEELMCSWLWTKSQPIIDIENMRYVSPFHSYYTTQSEWQMRNTVWHCVKCVVPGAIQINYNTTDSIADYRVIELDEIRKIDLVYAQ